MLIIIILFIIIFIILIATFITFFVIEHKSKQVIKEVSRTHPLWHDGERLIEKITDEWSIQTTDKLTLKAWYISADNVTSKYVIVANGYHSIRERIPGLCYLFHHLGYNVLVPAYRASAESEGKYIGFGWLDRDDYQRWIAKIIAQNSAAEIAMMGISMGGATTMMISGDDLPSNVKCFIADCGYDSLWNEIVHNAKQKFHLPAFPLVHLISLWSKIFAGYTYQEASSIKQLAKNTRPILFIHGNKDDFVPTSMVYRNYAATNAPKELLIVENAGHATAYETNIPLYRETVKNFLHKYL